MWFFAHVGITVGLAVVADNLYRRHRQYRENRPERNLGLDRPERARSISRDMPAMKGRMRRLAYWLGSSAVLDYRVLAVGSVLPDVDKYLSLITFNSFDRGVLHTLLAIGLVWVLGFVIFRLRSETRLLQLAYCWTLHLVLDQIWLNQKVLLWPFKGWNLGDSQMSLVNFIAYMTHSLTSDPSQFIPEMLGATVLAGILIWVAARRITTQNLGLEAPIPRESFKTKMENND